MVSVMRNRLLHLVIGLVLLSNHACKTTRGDIIRDSDYYCYELPNLHDTSSLKINVYTLNCPALSLACDSMIQFSNYCAFCHNSRYWFQMFAQSTSDTAFNYNITAHIWQFYSNNQGNFHERKPFGVFYYHDVPFYIDKLTASTPLFKKTDSIVTVGNDPSPNSTIYVIAAGYYAISQCLSARFTLSKSHCELVSSSKQCTPYLLSSESQSQDTGTSINRRVPIPNHQTKEEESGQAKGKLKNNNNKKFRR